MPRRRNDEGFSLVEILAALLVMATVTTAIGGLFGLVRQSMDRGREATATLAALTKALAFADELSAAAPTAIGHLSGNGHLTLALAAEGEPGDATSLVLTLERSPDLSLRASGAIATTLDLAPFDAASELFLVATPSYAWTADPADRDILGLRLQFAKAERNWDVMLWLAAPGRVQ